MVTIFTHLLEILVRPVRRTENHEKVSLKVSHLLILGDFFVNGKNTPSTWKTIFLIASQKCVRLYMKKPKPTFVI